MIAMQYSFTLPSDYDMSIIDRRIQEKGHALDNHAPLAFKAYLTARKEDPITQSKENLYAPFYLWRDCEGIRDFISCAGFVGLTNFFGWPNVLSWPAIVGAEQDGEISLARFAQREIVPIDPFSDLEALQRSERELSSMAIQDSHALLALSAFEPTTWTLVRFRMWRDCKFLKKAARVQAYNVQHVSNPAGN